ncbi:MAG: hypothetical protein Q9187_007560 [Circinaria calcarea]
MSDKRSNLQSDNKRAYAVISRESSQPRRPESSNAEINHEETWKPRDQVENLQEEILGLEDGANALAEHEVDSLETVDRTLSWRPPYSVFSKGKKHYIVFIVAWAGLFSPLSANIYFPALNTLTKELRVSNELINLTLTSYMIFQGLALTIFGDLADMAGDDQPILLDLLYISEQTLDWPYRIAMLHCLFSGACRAPAAVER